MEGIATIIGLIKKILWDFIVEKGIKGGDFGALIAGLFFLAFLIGVLILIFYVINKAQEGKF